jgi:redox-sensing transcriptional repressor
MKKISHSAVHRLILYRKLLKIQLHTGDDYIYSHNLAQLAGRTPAQVRRDLMYVAYSGSTVRGYHIAELVKSISMFIDSPTGQGVALVGLGNLGKAILNYTVGLNPKVEVRAVFDKDPVKIGTITEGITCFDVHDLEKIIDEKNINVAIISIPSEGAQTIADRLIAAGVIGILNYSSIRLNVPENIYVENRDMMRALEKTAFLGRYFNNQVIF